jgi:hypothetical protein
VSRALSRSINLEDIPCSQGATENEIEWLEWAARTIWQPVVDRWGPVAFTSWRYWQNGGACSRARTGDHSHPGTLDAVPLEAGVTEVFEWMGANLRSWTGAPLWGSLIDERTHIHQTAPGVGAGPEGEYLHEPTEGVYEARALPAARPLVLGAGALLLWAMAQKG